jgi:hypothetical protein
MRQYIRHPTEIPIEIRGPAFPVERRLARNVGIGGLAFHATRSMEPGSLVTLRIAGVDPAFESQARIVWCRPRDDGFDLGVTFLTAEDAHRARMVEQVCYIERYKQTVLDTERRTLSSEEAAREWIAKFASAFPRPETH